MSGDFLYLSGAEAKGMMLCSLGRNVLLALLTLSHCFFLGRKHVVIISES